MKHVKMWYLSGQNSCNSALKGWLNIITWFHSCFLSSFTAIMWNQNNLSPRFVFSNHFTRQIYFLKKQNSLEIQVGTMYHVMSMSIYCFLIYKTRIIISSCRTLSRSIVNNVCRSILKNYKVLCKCKVSLVIITTITLHSYETKSTEK